MKPLFIVFEGIDGSGKSTLAASVAKKMDNEGLAVFLGHEPTSFATGLKIRQFLRNEIHLSVPEQLNLFLEDRKLSVEKNILPNLHEGKHVILDRYFYSTAAYQASNETRPAEIIQMNLQQGFPLPDVLFYLEISPQEAMTRIGNRGASESFEKTETLEKISQNYEKILPPHTIRLNGREKPEVLLQGAMKTIKSLLQ